MFAEARTIKTLFPLLLISFSAASGAYADYRNADDARNVPVEKCDGPVFEAAQKYVSLNEAEFKKMDFRPPEGASTIRHCAVSAKYSLNGKQYVHASITLGKVFEIDYFRPYSFELLLGDDYVYRPKHRLFSSGPGAFSSGEEQLSQMFNATGCISVEAFSANELFFDGKTPCQRRVLQPPFEGTIEACDGRTAKTKTIGLRKGSASWDQILAAADSAFQSAGLVPDGGEIVDDNGMLWGDPFTTIAPVAKDGGFVWAILTTGYIKGREPSIFTVVSSAGKATPPAVLQRGNYTCANLRSWVKDGVPDSIRD